MADKRAFTTVAARLRAILLGKTRYALINAIRFDEAAKELRPTHLNDALPAGAVERVVLMRP